MSPQSLTARLIRWAAFVFLLLGFFKIMQSAQASTAPAAYGKFDDTSGLRLAPRPTKTPKGAASPTPPLTPTNTLTTSPTSTGLATSTPRTRATQTATGVTPPTVTPTPTKTQTTTPAETLTPSPTVTGLPSLTPTPTQPSPGNGPFAHWKFDETSGTSAADSSGNNYSGTLVNGPTWAAGHVDGALNFDGIDDHVATVDDPLDITGSLTISAWVVHTSNSTARHIASKNHVGVSTPWQLAILTTNKLRSYTRGSDLDQAIDSNDSISLNAWHHVVFVRDAVTSKVTFYIDGSQDSGGWQTYTPARVSASGVTAKIGSRGDGASNFFSGKIDDLRIYNRALSPDEVLALYLGEPGGGITVSISSPVGGATVDGTIAVEVSATADTGINRVELLKNGVLYARDALAPYTFLWSTALEPNEAYTLTAVAVDSSGNTATSQPLNVTVNNPPVTAPPNIVVVLTDDQRWDTMQYMPVTNSRLFADSIRFTNAIAAVPLCCPSRASIFTGLYSHNHGVIDNKLPYGAPAFDDSSTIATWLDGIGYRTGLFGKYLNEYDDIAPYVPPGWDQFYAFLTNNENYYDYALVENGTMVPYNHLPEDYSTNVLTGKAVQFITTANPAEPVFVYLSLFAPHFNHNGSEMDSPPEPGPGDDGAYADLAPWRPATYNEADVSDKPLWVRKLPLMTPADMETGDLFRIKQLESLLAVDRAIGDLIDALVQAGRYDNTVFVFLSDNGLSWGEHRWNWKKWCAYEECVRIPFWVRVPGAAGRDEDALVNDVDLGPTLAELAGALPPAQVDGFSLVNLIKNPLAAWRTEAYTEYLGPFQPTGVKIIYREVRTTSYMYAEYDTSDREFYDLLIDPLQELNRVNDPNYAQTVSDLQRVLQTLKDQ